MVSRLALLPARNARRSARPADAALDAPATTAWAPRANHSCSAQLVSSAAATATASSASSGPTPPSSARAGSHASPFVAACGLGANDPQNRSLTPRGSRLRDCPARNTLAPISVASALASARVRRTSVSRSSPNVTANPTDVTSNASTTSIG